MEIPYTCTACGATEFLQDIEVTVRSRRRVSAEPGRYGPDVDHTSDLEVTDRGWEDVSGYRCTTHGCEHAKRRVRRLADIAEPRPRHLPAIGTTLRLPDGSETTLLSIDYDDAGLPVLETSDGRHPAAAVTVIPPNPDQLTLAA